MVNTRNGLETHLNYTITHLCFCLGLFRNVVPHRHYISLFCRYWNCKAQELVNALKWRSPTLIIACTPLKKYLAASKAPVATVFAVHSPPIARP